MQQFVKQHSIQRRNVNWFCGFYFLVAQIDWNLISEHFYPESLIVVVSSSCSCTIIPTCPILAWFSHRVKWQSGGDGAARLSLLALYRPALRSGVFERPYRFHPQSPFVVQVRFRSFFLNSTSDRPKKVINVIYALECHCYKLYGETRSISLYASGGMMSHRRLPLLLHSW